MTTLFNNIFNLEQTSYWLLVIWWFGAGLILHAMPKKEELVFGQRRLLWYWVSVVIMVLPYILWTGYRPFVADTGAYARHFNNSTASFGELLRTITSSEDWGFYGLMIVLKMLGVQTYQAYFLVMAAIQLWCMTYIFRKYSTSFWTSFFMFIASTDYISWMQNGMRQFTAVCITFAAFDLLVRRKYIWFVVVILFASTFHASALIVLPFAYVMNGPALNRKSFLMIGAVALMIPLMDSLTPLLERLLADTQYGDVIGGEIWLNDDGTNMVRVLVYSVPALMALLGFRYILRSRDRAANLCINASMITMAVYVASAVTSGIYIGRIPIYTTLHGYAVLPWLIDQIFEKLSAKLMKLLLVLFYLAFFVYQMRLWELI